MNELNNLRNQWTELATGKHEKQATKAWRVVDLPEIEDEELCETQYLQSLINVTKELVYAIQYWTSLPEERR